MLEEVLLQWACRVRLHSCYQSRPSQWSRSHEPVEWYPGGLVLDLACNCQLDCDSGPSAVRTTGQQIHLNQDP